MDERTVTVYHESGHALACYRTRTTICFVSVERGEDCLGMVLRSKVWRGRVEIIEGQNHGRRRARRWAHRIALIALAGPAAEERFTGRPAEGSEHDERRAQRFLACVCDTADELAENTARIRAEATKMVNEGWPLIEAFARRLRDRGQVWGRHARRVFRLEQERLDRPPRCAGPPITEDDLRGLPGLRQVAIMSLLANQPRTVKEALAIRNVGRKTTRDLVAAGLLTDPDGVQRCLPRRG